MSALQKPDRDRGLFETMLIHDGRAIELDAHLMRMSASLESLFGSAIPSAARELVLKRARGIDLGRLRLTVAPDGGGGLGAEVATAVAEPALLARPSPRAIRLQGHVLRGGLGAHKWADRRQLQSAEAAAPNGSIPLLSDGNGDLLEASRANVFLVRDGVLLTPATDGRILPGIARLRVIEVAREASIEVREGRVDLDFLTQADEVFLSGSVHGVQPASSLDGADLSAGREVSELIATGLRRRWLDESGPGFAPVPAAAPPPGRPGP
jgi:para-aminobenzoate synthetase / 4-amino-4-deoxychorismate lyase